MSFFLEFLQYFFAHLFTPFQTGLKGLLSDHGDLFKKFLSDGGLIKCQQLQDIFIRKILIIDGDNLFYERLKIDLFRIGHDVRR
jgi:hypothetical protein